MKRVLIVFLLTAALLAACGPAPTPQPTVDVNATVVAMSGTMVAATLTAQPTATPLPTNTPLPTDTPTIQPTDTPTPGGSPTATATQAGVTPAPTFTGCFIPTGATSLTAPFKIENFTSVTVNVTINGVTTNGDHPISCSYDVAKGQSLIFTIWFGNYSYWVQVPGRKIYTDTFWVNDSDKSTMQVTTKGIKIGPFP